MPKPDEDKSQPEQPPVRPPTLPPDFPDIPSSTPDQVAGTTPAPAEPETQGKPRPALEKPRAAA